MNRRLLAACGAALALVSAACTPKAVEPLPPAPKLPSTTTTIATDFSGVGLGAVAPGRTTTTVKFGPGRATLAGTVVGPDGPVPGAVVRAERIVGDATATMDIVTGPDGAFTIPKVLGGRYRIRTWKPAPDNLALLEPVVFFLEGSENKRVDLTMRRFTGISASAAIAPDPPIINAPANLVVQVVDQAVDPNGIVRSTPRSGVRVELFGAGDWRLLTPAVTSADGAGRARWQLECRKIGNQPLSVVVEEGSTFNLNLPECAEPPPVIEDPAPTEEESPPTSSAATPASSTTTPTTRPAAPATSAPATTTTTRPASTTTTARPGPTTTAGN